MNRRHTREAIRSLVESVIDQPFAETDPFTVTVSTDWLKPDQWRAFEAWSDRAFGPYRPDEPPRPTPKERNDQRAAAKRVAKRRAKKKRANRGRA